MLTHGIFCTLIMFVFCSLFFRTGQSLTGGDWTVTWRCGSQSHLPYVSKDGSHYHMYKDQFHLLSTKEGGVGTASVSVEGKKTYKQSHHLFTLIVLCLCVKYVCNVQLLGTLTCFWLRLDVIVCVIVPSHNVINCFPLPISLHTTTHSLFATVLWQLISDASRSRINHIKWKTTKQHNIV